MRVVIDEEFVICVEDEDDIQTLEDNTVWYYQSYGNPYEITIIEQKIDLDETYMGDVLMIFEYGCSGISLRPYNINRYKLKRC